MFANKKLLSVALVVVLAFSHFVTTNAAASELSTSARSALELIASRKGTNRLDFDEEKQQWSLFETSWTTVFLRPLSKKNRFDIISPLENLAGELEEYSRSAQATAKNFHLIRQAYSSLSSLYSYYKINPHRDVGKQADFMRRYGAALARLKAVLNGLECQIPVAKLHKPLPWFGEQGSDLTDAEQNIGLKYLDMGEKSLKELNKALAESGNLYTKVDRAAEFYPSEKHTAFRSKISETVSKKIAIFVVHGTFAAGSPEYISDKHILFQQTKFMAQSIANDQNVPVELYAFGWSGVNSNEDRMVAGEELANFVNSYFPSEEYHDIYIGHSHGGNVVFHFAKTQREYRTPYMVVTLATPIRKDFITDNVNYLFEFYTPSDVVQYLGSFEVSLRNSTGTGTHHQSPRLVRRDDIQSLGLFQNNSRFEGAKIYATRTLLNARDMRVGIKSHSDMKYLIGALPRVIDNLIQYKPNGTFALNVELNEHEDMSPKQMERLQFQIVKTE